MPKIKLVVIAAAAALAASQPGFAQTTLTMSSWVSPQHHLTRVVLAGWAADVEKATNGRLKFQMLPKHPAAPPGTFDAVRDGLVDVSYVTASYTPARHIVMLMPELPGMGDTAEVNSVAFSRVYWKHLHKVGEYNGVKLIGVFTHGPGQMFTKKTIKGIADIQGAKIRTGGGIAEAVANALGASAFVKPAPESYELLKSGVADGVFFPLESIVSFKLDTVIGQGTLFPGGMYSSAFGFFMNQGKWDKLSKEDQAAIDKLGYEHLARFAGKSWDEADRAGLEGIEEGRGAGRQRRPGVRRRGAQALRADRRRLDQEGERQGHRRGQGARRVPRRAEAGRRRQVSDLPGDGAGAPAVPEHRWERRFDAVLGIAASAILMGMMLLTFVDVVGRYVFNQPVRGGFEVTELGLLVLIFAGLPLVSHADEHVTMDFIDRLLSPRGRAVLERSIHALCAAIFFFGAWLVWLKADRIWEYRDATDVLRIVYGPFVYFMAVMIALTGLIHLHRAFARR